MRVILLIMIGLSSFVFADFTKNGDIVTDTSSGLQWQDDADAKNVEKIWGEAIDYCENLTLGGHDDWRLPNINELKSIVDRSKYNLAIVGGFTNISSGDYWSSTTDAGDGGNAWNVDFGSGGYVSSGFVGNGDFKSSSNYVRCVRAGE